MDSSYDQQQIDLVADNKALIDALENMIDGAQVWSDRGNCCYCNGANHKKDCEYTAAIALLNALRAIMAIWKVL